MTNNSIDFDSDDVEAYGEPDAQNDQYPDHWTPKQCENWKNYGHFEYNALETDVGRQLYRRIWRPKMRGEGIMKRDHVKLGTPEDYVEDNVRDLLTPMGNITSAMMRNFVHFNADTDVLDEAVDDIVHAKLSLKDPGEKEELEMQANQLSRAYGITADGDD